MKLTAKASPQPVILILPGWGISKTCMSPLSVNLSQYYPVLQIDLPGQGAAMQAPTLDDFLTDCERQLSDRQVIIIGWSLGALLGLSLAKRLQHRCTANIALNMGPSFVQRVHYGGGLSADVLTDFISRFERRPKLALKRFQTLMTKHSPNTQATDFMQQANSADMNMAGLAWGLKQLAEIDHSEKLPEAPCLWLAGNRDALLPNAHHGLTLRPGDEAHYIPDAGHLMHWSHSDATIKHIKRFIGIQS